MSEILQKLDAEIKESMKARNQARLDTIRMIKTAVKNKEIELIRPLTQPEFFSLVNTLSNQRKDSIDQFKKGGRDDLVVKEEAELKILEGFLPVALSENEVATLINGAIAETKASSPKDMGAVMKALKDKAAGRVDGKVLSDLVRNRLQNLS